MLRFLFILLFGFCVELLFAQNDTIWVTDTLVVDTIFVPADTIYTVNTEKKADFSFPQKFSAVGGEYSFLLSRYHSDRTYYGQWHGAQFCYTHVRKNMLFHTGVGIAVKSYEFNYAFTETTRTQRTQQHVDSSIYYQVVGQDTLSYAATDEHTKTITDSAVNNHSLTISSQSVYLTLPVMCGITRSRKRCNVSVLMGANGKVLLHEFASNKTVVEYGKIDGLSGKRFLVDAVIQARFGYAVSHHFLATISAIASIPIVSDYSNPRYEHLKSVSFGTVVGLSYLLY